jgi:hypothetical protein
LADFKLLDELDALMKAIKAHPAEEALFSVVPAAAGAFLSRRRGGLGAPLGAMLMGLGGIGAYQGLKGLIASASAPSFSTINNPAVAPAGSTIPAITVPGMAAGPPAPGAAAVAPAAPAASSPSAAAIQRFLPSSTAGTLAQYTNFQPPQPGTLASYMATAPPAAGMFHSILKGLGLVWP